MRAGCIEQCARPDNHRNVRRRCRCAAVLPIDATANGDRSAIENLLGAAATTIDRRHSDTGDIKHSPLADPDRTVVGLVRRRRQRRGQICNDIDGDLAGLRLQRSIHGDLTGAAADQADAASGIHRNSRIAADRDIAALELALRTQHQIGPCPLHDLARRERRQIERRGIHVERRIGRDPGSRDRRIDRHRNIQHRSRSDRKAGMAIDIVAGETGSESIYTEHERRAG